MDTICRLPPEILSKIFVTFCSNSDENDRFLQNWETCSRVTLSSVCVVWRNAAHATPELWSELKIYSHVGSRSGPKHSDIAAQWLNRSGVRPLDLSVSLGRNYMGNICEAFPAFACRIRSLEVRIPMRHFEPFVHLPKSSFPWLEKLVLRFRDQHPFHVSEKLKSKYPHGIEIFSGSHQLKHVEFDEIGGDSLLKTILFPRDAVTTLMVGATSHLGTQFTGLYFDALRSMNKLVDCTIQFPGKQSDISSHADQPINLPFLQSLTLSASEEVDTGYDVAFFRCLYAPCLKYLWLSVGASENHGELVRQLASFRERSTVSLSSLTLSHFIVRPISGEDLISLVAVFPSISILRTTLTSGVLDTSPLMRALVYNPDHPGPLLPNLEELRLESTTVNGKDVWNLVRSYWCSNNSRLRMVDILFFTGGTDGGGPYAELEHESALHGIDLTIDLYVYDY